MEHKLTYTVVVDQHRGACSCGGWRGYGLSRRKDVEAAFHLHLEGVEYRGDSAGYSSRSEITGHTLSDMMEAIDAFRRDL